MKKTKLPGAKIVAVVTILHPVYCTHINQSHGIHGTGLHAHLIAIDGIASKTKQQASGHK